MKTGLLIVALLAIPGAVLLRNQSKPGVPATTVAAARPPDRSHWEILYENASLEQVVQDIALLRRLLDEGTTDYYSGEFERGNYQVEGHFTPREAYALHRSGDELCARRFLKSGEVRKVVLPREQFPDMYELRDQIAWLSHREDELAHLAQHD